MNCFRPTTVGLLFLVASIGCAHAQRVEEHWVSTGRPSGDPINDQVWFNFFPAAGASAASPAPCVIIIHGLGLLGTSQSSLAGRGVVLDALTTPFGRYLASHGVAAVALDLPYHMRRRAPGKNPVDYFASADPEKIVEVSEQSLADIQAVKAWVLRRNDIDSGRLGLVGISLGAIAAQRAMGEDPAFSAGVAIVGIGDLPAFYRSSPLMRLLHGGSRTTDPRRIALLESVDPIENASRNRPRRVLMIQAARDMVFPPRLAVELWEALGRPPVRWLDTNHLGPILGMDTILRGSLEFLTRSWAGRPFGHSELTDIGAPTIKIGLMSGLGTPISPAIQLQVFGIGRTRERMTLVSGNIGLNVRGLFLSVGLTVNAFVEVGAGRRANNQAIYPYVSFHIVL